MAKHVKRISHAESSGSTREPGWQGQTQNLSLDMNTNRPLIVVVLALLAIRLNSTSSYSGSTPSQAGRRPAPASNQESGKATPDQATYLRDVQPIFMGKCARCHNGQSMLPNWLDYKKAFSERTEIKRRVWDSWRGAYYKQPMPAGNSPECQAITDEERRTIKEWVAGGASYGEPVKEPTPQNKGERIENGKRIYAQICAACHQPTGQGLPNQFPPLAESDFLNSNKQRAIKVLLHGRQGQIVVNGKAFNNSMPTFPFSDEDIASALTFVYNSFGNSGKEVTVEEVAAARADKVDETEQTHVVSSTPAPVTPFE
jgi:mono/diheme cytochrome c family protein